MENRLLKPSEVDIIFRYPTGRTQRLAKAGKIPFIELPDGENPIETLAKVIRTEKNDDGHYDVAVCFLDMASGDRLRLDKYVKEV